jgi:hypothetical protein
MLARCLLLQLAEAPLVLLRRKSFCRVGLKSENAALHNLENSIQRGGAVAGAAKGGQCIARNRLQNHYLQAFQSLARCSTHCDLPKSPIRSAVLDTHTLYNIQVIDDRSCTC